MEVQMPLLGCKKSEASRRGRASRNKGKRGERELANMLKARGFDARRGVQFKGGINSPDVICESLEFIHMEAKWVEALNIYNAYKQSKDDSGKEKIPVVVHKKSHREVMVTMSFFDWINLVQCAMMIEGDPLNTMQRLVDEQKLNNTEREKQADSSLL